MTDIRKDFEAVYSTGESIIDAHSLAMRDDGEYEQALARLCFKYFSKGYQAGRAHGVDGLISKIENEMGFGDEDESGLKLALEIIRKHFGKE